MNKFPFVLQVRSPILLRFSVAFIFLSHSIVRIANSTIERFGGFLESKGFPYSVAWVWEITTI